MKRIALFVMVCAVASVLADSASDAAQLVVAFGASDTAGKGVSRTEAYPAQLQAALRAQGHSVQVVNAGISGNTTAAMLARANSVASPGAVVIYQPGGNDTCCGNAIQPAQTSANIDATLARLQARGVHILMFAYGNPQIDSAGLAARHGATFLGGFHQGIPRNLYLSDGQHVNGEGYALVVQRILSSVESALGGR